MISHNKNILQSLVLNSKCIMDQFFYPISDPKGFLTRKDFGNDFLFGSSTSAFQIEGGYQRDGRGPSIFDTFAKKRDLFAPYGEDAVNHREHYKEDVRLMKKIGFDAYRFSISWSRILPTGKKESKSQEGIDFYRKLIKRLKEAGITPIATLLHFDPPQNLEDEYYTFLSRNILDDFCDYAEICFQEFGHDVKHWITINEPWGVAYGGYIIGELPPAYKTMTNYQITEQTQKKVKNISFDVTEHTVDFGKVFAETTGKIGKGLEERTGGLHGFGKELAERTGINISFDEFGKEFAQSTGKINFPYSEVYSSLCPPIKSSIKSWLNAKISSATDNAATPKHVTKLPAKEKWPYLAAHNQILAHAKAARLYKEKYQKDQGGKIGLNLVTEWFIPLTDKKEDKEAAQRAMDFMFGWFMDPLYRGDYPMNMRLNVTEGHLPDFDDDDVKMVKGSYDFISLNYYTSNYVAYEETEGGNYVYDRRVRFYENNQDDQLIGSVQGAAKWVHGYPKGLLDLLLYIKGNYGDPEIYITENGIDDLDDDSMSQWNSFDDQKRTLYLHDHLSYIKEALRQGVKVKGHFVWSFLDNLELNSGFKYRFGIIYVDYNDKKSKRAQKSSVSWYKHFLKN